jgi:HKD family nuclease
MAKCPPGLYEILVTESLAVDLDEIAGDLIARKPLHQAEAADRLALHVARVLERTFGSLPEKDRVKLGVAIARELLTNAQRAVQQALDSDESIDVELPSEAAELLHGIWRRQLDGKPAPIEPPLTPLLDTTVLTNAPGEPRVGQQIHAEIASADRIDLVMAFIRRSGLRPLEDSLRRHCQEERPLRVLTTTYTQSTELAALEALEDLGASVRISYDTTTTRLHAKAWLFHRDSGFSTAFIGSSNLTHSAHVTGLEWNVRASSARNPDLLQKVAAVFDSYWHGGDFLVFDREQYLERTKQEADRTVRIFLSPVELRLEPFQERLLEQIALARERGHHRNLLASATGTGKTVMAAVDYARLRARPGRSRLLFVAHRKEILEQSLATFRHALRDPSFGELWVDGHRPEDFDHVFASIQSLHATSTEHLLPDHFDVVIVDEFHHAAAESYARLLAHIEPRELLGLTATPERSDGLDILGHFDGRIAAELRLWDAIDQPARAWSRPRQIACVPHQDRVVS